MIEKGYRPVTIAAITGRVYRHEAYLDMTEQLAKQHPDVIVLPECWSNQRGCFGDEIMQQISRIASENRVYILHHTMLMDGDRLYNTALMFDRSGEIVGRYDKIFPYYNSAPAPDSWEYEKRPEQFESVPGALDQPLIECDFGKVAVRICFDANFPEIWESAREQGAELVLWPSAYAAGRQLEAHALNHHYPIVTATTSGHFMVIDIDGKRVTDTRGSYQSLQSHFATLDLDRCIFHENFNTEKLKRLTNELPPRIEKERHDEEAQWIIVRSAHAGVSAREVCREAGMEELTAYQNRTRGLIRDLRPE